LRFIPPPLDLRIVFFNSTVRSLPGLLWRFCQEAHYHKQHYWTHKTAINWLNSYLEVKQFAVIKVIMAKPIQRGKAPVYQKF